MPDPWFRASYLGRPVVNTGLCAWLQLHAWAEFVSVCVHDLIGGDLGELLREGGWSDTENWGWKGGIVDCQVGQQHHTEFSTLFIFSLQLKGRNRETSVNTDPLSTDLPRLGAFLKRSPLRSKPLHYSPTGLLSWVCCAFCQFQAFLNN